jgi:putative endonuclease
MHRAEGSRQRPEGGLTNLRCTTFTFLQSVAGPGHFYIGPTDNLRQRLRQHQADVDAHAAKYRPWKLKTYLGFERKATAIRFESYLKSGSGRAFCKRHFD